MENDQKKVSGNSIWLYRRLKDNNAGGSTWKQFKLYESVWIGHESVA